MDGKLPGFKSGRMYSASTTAKRVNIGIGTVVYGWPSTGGRYDLVSVSAFELDFLGLDRFTECDKSGDLVAEDAFCQKMRNLGARYCRYPNMTKSLQHDDEKMWFGWPNRGGVSMLKLTRSECYRQGTGRIHLAKNMEERCKAIEMCGGQFFSDPKTCEEAKGLVD